MIIIPLILYNLIFPVLFVLYLPVFLTRLIKRGDFIEGFWERFGIFSASKKKKLKNLQKPVWIHAVSVGETVAALSFIREWSKKEPDIQFVLSTTTSTGQEIIRKHSPENVISIYCPLDFFIFIWSAIQTINPKMIIIFEVEIWPNLIIFSAWQDIKLALVNCRMSDKSAHSYARFRWFFRYVFTRFSLICTQTDKDTGRIKTIIGDQPYIKTCNNMKFDQTPIHCTDNHLRLIDAVFPENDRIIFTAASTHQGEEIIMIRAFKSLIADFPSLQFILVPRHAERAIEIKKILINEQVDFVLFTELNKSLKNRCDTAQQGSSEKVIIKKNKNRALLVDTTGELMDLLAVSDIVFVGKSLGGNKGGHNIIEPAIFGKPIIFGKNMDNFQRVAQIFKDNNACFEVENEQDFLQALRHLLSDPAERDRLGKVSQETVEKNRGAINRTIELLRKT